MPKPQRPSFSPWTLTLKCVLTTLADINTHIQSDPWFPVGLFTCIPLRRLSIRLWVHKILSEGMKPNERVVEKMRKKNWVGKEKWRRQRSRRKIVSLKITCRQFLCKDRWYRKLHNPSKLWVVEPSASEHVQKPIPAPKVLRIL